ncbi:MAG: diphthine--ammonia ligase [Acidobacteria bacterium]|jgi:uncharacterized protein (TIGR00290 family)|nr:MAG: diphthine--ammonia ligase [Acidobacteriota bacterium]GIU81162.1 MAG: hypothetical protein KatS3mg006_0226 [Pyrinomonadaceae bacterium]
MAKAVMNWSGGKDSAIALYRALRDKNLEVKYLLTTVNEHWQRVSMHGVRRELLKAQAEAIGIELIEVMLPEVASMEVYESQMSKAWDFLIEKGVTHAIFGDIFLEDLRKYREDQLAKKGLHGVFPLWGCSTKDLIEEFLALKFRAVIVCADASKLDAGWCGRLIDGNFLAELPAGVDPCGENGEFHTFVFDAPYFKKPIEIEIGEVVYREQEDKNASWSTKFYYCDLVCKSNS